MFSQNHYNRLALELSQRDAALAQVYAAMEEAKSETDLVSGSLESTLQDLVGIQDA